MVLSNAYLRLYDIIIGKNGYGSKFAEEYDAVA